MEINFKELLIMLIDFLENFHFSFFARKRWRKGQGWRYGTGYYDSRSETRVRGAGQAVADPDAGQHGGEEAARCQRGGRHRGKGRFSHTGKESREPKFSSLERLLNLIAFHKIVTRALKPHL